MESNARAVYDNGYIKPKIRKYGDKVYINFLGLNVSEVGLYWDSFTIYWLFTCL